MVEKILFDTTDPGRPRATGVQISKGLNAWKYCIRARREVIVCSGSISTPHLLLVSGLGPKNELENLDIPVIRDHPQVGRNFVDVCTTL
jgi:choline dehydrogenase